MYLIKLPITSKWYASYLYKYLFSRLEPDILAEKEATGN